MDSGAGAAGDYALLPVCIPTDIPAARSEACFEVKLLLGPFLVMILVREQCGKTVFKLALGQPLAESLLSLYPHVQLETPYHRKRTTIQGPIIA